MQMEVRRRIPYSYEENNKETFTERLKKVDTFEKLPQECINYTSSGGGGISKNLNRFSFHNYFFCDNCTCICRNFPIFKS